MKIVDFIKRIFGRRKKVTTRDIRDALDSALAAGGVLRVLVAVDADGVDLPDSVRETAHRDANGLRIVLLDLSRGFGTRFPVSLTAERVEARLSFKGTPSWVAIPYGAVIAACPLEVKLPDGAVDKAALTLLRGGRS
jgi:hypothetical protein